MIWFLFITFNKLLTSCYFWLDKNQKTDILIIVRPSDMFIITLGKV